MKVKTVDEKNSVKDAYTHGFEEIYALEEVDTQTIRPMGAVADSAKNKPKESKQKKQFHLPQLYLDFSGRHRQSMSSFVLKEPMQRLGLSKNLEACLISKNIKTISGALNIPEGELPAGHLREIEEKIKSYIGGKALHDVDTVDYHAWMRSLLVGLRPIDAYLYLEKWGIQNLIQLTAQEKMDARRIVDDRRLQCIQSVEQHLASDAVRLPFLDSLREVADVFIRPWLRGRMGLAVTVELKERLVGIAADQELVVEILAAFSHGHGFLLDRTLSHADSGLYAPDIETAEAYDAVVDKALTYFYNDAVCYPLAQLKGLVMREMAKGWQGFPEEFVVKALRYSPKFLVQNGKEHQLKITLR